MRYSLNQVLCYAVSFWLPKRRLEIAGVVCGSKPDCLPGDMIFAVKREFGLVAMLLSECILFGGCAAVCVLSDLFFRGPGMLIHIPGLIVCVMTFGLCGENRGRAFQKYGFIVFSYLCGGPWMLALAFLIAYEHFAIGKGFGQREVSP